jgi:hypothetical protein
VDSTDDVTSNTASASLPEPTVQQWFAAGQLPAIADNRGSVVGPVDVQRLVALQGTSPSTLAATIAHKASSAMANAVEDAAALAARAVEQSAAVQHLREQLRALGGSRVAVGARLDELYRAQVATNNREIAELRQRWAAGATGNGPAAPGSTGTAALSGVNISTAVRAETATAAATTRTVRAAAHQQRLAILSNAAVFIVKLDQLYRAQIAAKDGEIAAKDEMIVELQRRAERVALQAALLEQKLADLRVHAEVVETQPVRSASRPGLLRRLMSWYWRLQIVD